MNLKDLDVVQTAINMIGKDVALYVKIIKSLENRLEKLERSHEQDMKDQWKMISELRKEVEKCQLNQ